MSPKQRYFRAAYAEMEKIRLQAEIDMAEVEAYAEKYWRERQKGAKREIRIDQTARALCVEKPSRKERLFSWVLGLSEPIKSLYPSELAVWSE